MRIIVIFVCLFHIVDAMSKGNPNPEMLKGQRAKMRILTSHSALRERSMGHHKPFQADTQKMKIEFSIKKSLFKPVKQLPVVDTAPSDHVDVYLRIKNKNDDWHLAKSIPLNTAESTLKVGILTGGIDGNEAQAELQTLLTNRLFGKGLGRPAFVHEILKRDQIADDSREENIEYGYRIHDNFTIAVLPQKFLEPVVLKRPPVPQISIESFLHEALRKEQILEPSPRWIAGIDQLVQIIDRMPCATLLVSTVGSVELGEWDRRKDVCVAVGGGVVITPISKSRIGNESIAPESMFVRISNLHTMVSGSAISEYFPGLVGLAIMTLLLDTYKQKDVEPPPGLQIQLQSNSQAFLDTIRETDPIDVQNGANNNERNKLAVTFLAQQLYAAQSLSNVKKDNHSRRIPVEFSSVKDLSLDDLDAVGSSVPSQAYWMAGQLATPRAQSAPATRVIANVHARSMIQSLLPNWEEKGVIDIDAKDILKICAPLWPFTKSE